jgi:hypothetical protein
MVKNSRKSKRTKTKTRKNKCGGNKNCTSKCKTQFIKEIQQDKRYRVINKMASFLGKKSNVDDELNKVLDSKDIQNDAVFKDCVNKCKKKTNIKTRKNKRGGNVDNQRDSDFNPNLSYDSKQNGGQNVGSNCKDPNFSIYNTNLLKLSPYKP